MCFNYVFRFSPRYDSKKQILALEHKVFWSTLISPMSSVSQLLLLLQLLAVIISSQISCQTTITNFQLIWKHQRAPVPFTSHGMFTSRFSLRASPCSSPPGGDAPHSRKISDLDYFFLLQDDRLCWWFWTTKRIGPPSISANIRWDKTSFRDCGSHANKHIIHQTVWARQPRVSFQVRI